MFHLLNNLEFIKMNTVQLKVNRNEIEMHNSPSNVLNNNVIFHWLCILKYLEYKVNICEKLKIDISMK